MAPSHRLPRPLNAGGAVAVSGQPEPGRYSPAGWLGHLNATTSASQLPLTVPLAVNEPVPAGIW